MNGERKKKVWKIDEPCKHCGGHLVAEEYRLPPYRYLKRCQDCGTTDRTKPKKKTNDTKTK